MAGQVLKAAVSTLQQPREQGPLADERGEKASEWASPFWPSNLRAARRARGPLCPRSALPLPRREVLLGRPKSCLTTSGSAELSDGAGGRNRRVHVLLPFPGSVDTLAGPKDQGQVP